MFFYPGREGKADGQTDGGGEGAEDQGQGNYQIEGNILPNVVVKWFTMEFTYIDPEVHASLFVFTHFFSTFMANI